MSPCVEGEGIEYFASMPHMGRLFLVAVLALPLKAWSQTCATHVTPFDGAGEAWNRAERITPRDSASATTEFRLALECRPSLAPGRAQLILGAVYPDIRLVAMEGIPDSRGDGSLWAGRGISSLIRLGATIDWGRVHVAVAPELWHAVNRPYDLLPGRDSARSTFSSPFFTGRNSLDIPSRMGRARVTVLTPGQSAAWANLGPLDVGVSSSNLWWGPGARDGLMFGPGAAGIPRFFVRTPRPVATPLGRVSIDGFFGILTESRWFDGDTSNDHRSLSAAALSWSPRSSDHFTVGIARAVQRVARLDGSVLRRASDALRAAPELEADRLTMFFVRLVVPDAGMRAWAEVATPRPMGRLRDFLTVPGDNLAYQLGVEQLIRHGASRWLLHAEAMTVEPGLMVRDRPSAFFYAGSGTPHGWTQRGQMLGAGTGPGSNAQWLSVDRSTNRWSAGVYGERVRWNNESLMPLYLATIFRHDVTMRMGTRASVRTTLMGYRNDIALDVSWGKRLNYLFQNTTWIEAFRTVDVSIPQVRLTVSPRP